MAPAARAWPVEAISDGHRELEDAQHQVGAGADQTLRGFGALLHHGQVEAGRGLAVTADDDHGPGVGLGLVEPDVQRVDHVVSEGVGLAVVHRERGDVVGEFDLQQVHARRLTSTLGVRPRQCSLERVNPLGA